MKKQKHILFIFRSLGTGGSQKVQAFVANACVKRGYKVSIISMSNEHCTLDIDSRIDIHTLDYNNIALNRDKPIKYFRSRMQYLINYRKKCRQLNPDLICVFLIDVVRLTVLALKGMSYPIVASERADPGQFSEYKIRQYNKSLNSCAAVVYQLEAVAKYYNVNSKVIQEVIPNPSIVRNTTQDTGSIYNNELFIFGAGRLTKQKRFDILIDAYEIVNNSHPEYRLKIYGDGNEMENLKQQVEKLGLSDNVDFMGDVKNIFHDTNEKSIFVLTSDFEGIPNVITEALINEVPCIATDCSPGGARLLLCDGKCGEIIERGNYKDVAKAIIKYINDPNYAKNKAIYGKKHIKKFNPEIIEDKWLVLFERIISNGKY